MSWYGGSSGSWYGAWYGGSAADPVGPVSAQAVRRLGLQLGLFYRPYQR